MKKLVVLLMFAASSCGTSTKSGACKDYKPAMSCPPGSDYQCVTNEDGCRQCACVRNQNYPDPPDYD